MPVFISIVDQAIYHEGGEKYLFNKGRYLLVYKSPNHPDNRIETVEDYADIVEYTNIFYNDSLFYVDPDKNKLFLFRDWPGNVPIYYYHNKEKKQLFISDSLPNLASKVDDIKVSLNGIKLFLDDRKHYHSHTIYEGIEMLHPGLCIEMDLTSFSFKIDHWYKPYKKTQISNHSEAKKAYLSAIDRSILRLIAKDKPVALMFSGGSDSAFLLTRLLELQYTNIHLFTICVEGSDLQVEYANEKAKIFNLKINPIYINKKEVFKNWLKLFEHCYHYLSDLRIDGIFSSAIPVFNYLKEYFKSQPVTIVWGSQYALISPVVGSRGILLYYFFSAIKRIKLLISQPALAVLGRVPALNKDHISYETYSAFKQLYADALKEFGHPTELMDMVLSTNYNSLKHWWMDWRGKTQQLYYPNAINVYPFHDRMFQEASMPIALNVRIGGAKNIFKMPQEYKAFFYSLLPSNVPVKSVKRGNYTALPEFLSLFKNEFFYTSLLTILHEPQNRKMVDWILHDCKITIPDSYEAFLRLDFQAVEKLSGIVFLITRTKTDRVSF